MFANLNILAIIASALVSLGLSFVWFTMLFRDAYIAALGRTKEQMDAGPSAIEASLYQLVGFIVLATAFSWLMQRTGMTSVMDAVTLAVLCWGAFFVALIGPMYAYQAFPLSMLGIVAGGYLVAFLATSAIIAAWR